MPDSIPQVPILIVDDNPENLLVMNAVLRSQEYQIFEASSGAQALVLFEKQEFAVILLDIQMPVMDGYEVAKRIRNMNGRNTTPIIFVTAGMNESGLIKIGYEAGAVDYLFKPVDPPIIRSKVKVFADLFLAKKEIEKQAGLLRLLDEQNRNSFLENALDAVIGMDEKGDVIYWNLQAENIFGWTKNEVIGKNLSELIIPDTYREKHREGMERFLKTGVGPILNKRIEVFGLRKNRDEFPVELAVTAVPVNNRITFSAFVRDISERKLEQLNLKKAVQARDEFIGVCSHELKTPLTSMQLQFQLASKLYHKNNSKVFDRENVIKRIDTTNRQLKRMGRLIENMLDVSRMATSEISMDKIEVDLVGLVQEVLSTFQDQLDFSKIKVSLRNKSKTPLTVLGDTFRLEQVITNLMSNAIKYGLSKPIEIILESQNNTALLSFVDHGMGIAKDDMDRIFGRYERAIQASEVSGLGLGLYISQQIIKAHKGNLKVTSTQGEGSTFRIELPLADVESQISL
jgi:PAS domain S-box-containing protein